MSTRPAAVPANAGLSPSSLSLRHILAAYGLIGTVGLGALLLALVLAPLIGGFPPGATYGQDVALNALRALVCIAALCLGMGAGQARKREVILLWATFGLTLLSLLIHSVFLTSPILLYAMLPAMLDWLCYALSFTLAARLARQDRRSAILLIGALLIGAALTAVFVARDYGQSAQAGIRDYRAQGLFFSPNFAGGLLALTLPALTAACLAARERIGALATGAAAALAFGALVATGSRAGVGIACLGLFVALVLALISRRQREDDVPLPRARVGALLAAFAVMGFAFRGPLLSRTGGDEHSGSFRTMTWKGTVAMAKANPLLGTGPGTFSVRYPRYAIVEKTDLAHSSYLQVASEEGFPALLTAAAAILSALFAGASALFRRDGTAGDRTRRLLLCGLIGGLIAGALRSLFDSEWSILGNGLPFWAAAGLAASFSPEALSGSSSVPGRGGWGMRAIAAAGLLLSFVLLYGAQARDTALTQTRQAAGMPPAPISVWPPDPNLLAATGQPEEAVRIEPSGKRLYQLARFYQRAGDTAKAVDILKRAADADPNSFQTWKLLADMQEASGDHAGAQDSWRELVRRYEGPAGQVRAIPEMTETYPAFAYAALGDDAAVHGNRAQAAALYARAAAVVEAYANTSPLYQQMELASASITGVDVIARRQEVIGLYTKVLAGWTKAEPAKATELAARRDATLARIAKMAQPAASAATGSG